MNNQELLKQFMKISELTNPLEQVIQLKKFNKVYKKSEFFKLTHLKIRDAFVMCQKLTLTNLYYTINNLLSEDNLSEYINSQLEKIDIGFVLNKFLYSIDYDNLKNILESLMPNTNIEDIASMTTELSSIMERLRG